MATSIYLKSGHRPLEHLLADQEEKETEVWSDISTSNIPKGRRSLLRRVAPWTLFHISIIGLYTVVLFTFIWLYEHKIYQRLALTISPANEALYFVQQFLDIQPHINGTYIGEPSEELDEAWRELLKNTNIRISEQEFRPLNRPGIALPDGGYLATLNVYHELHCIKRLHHFMYPEVYFPDISNHERHLNRLHNQHCLDVLRQSVMCHADTSLVTMRWGQHQPIPLANWTFPHQCVDFQKIDDWAGSRAVDVFQRNYLINPSLGPSFPNGYNPTIGVVTVD